MAQRLPLTASVLCFEPLQVVADGLVMVPEVFLMAGRGLGIASVVAFKPSSDTL